MDQLIADIIVQAENGDCLYEIDNSEWICKNIQLDDSRIPPMTAGDKIAFEGKFYKILRIAFEINESHFHRNPFGIRLYLTIDKKSI